MATKRLIPYSVHLPEDVYEKLKKAAEHRQASAMVRDAITMALEGSTPFEAGYKKAIKDCIKIIKTDELLQKIGMAKPLEAEMKKLIGGK